MEDLEPQTTFHFKTKKIRSVKHQAQMVSLLKKKKLIIIIIIKSMVLKTGPDRPVRPVQPGTGL